MINSPESYITTYRSVPDIMVRTGLVGDLETAKDLYQRGIEINGVYMYARLDGSDYLSPGNYLITCRHLTAKVLVR
jgi:hypothetical protein